MNPRIPTRWYFDIVSPYAYLHLKRFGELRTAVEAAYDFVWGEGRATDIEVGAARKEVH